MKRHAPARSLLRAPGLLLIAVCVLLLLPAAALAADGTPFFPRGVFATSSTENPQLDGSMLVFEAYALSGSPAAKSQRGTVHMWNVATNATCRIGPLIGDQRHPTIGQKGNQVFVVWQHRSSPGAGTDLWVWWGGPRGPYDGFPRLLVSGPAGSSQSSPDLAVTQVRGKSELVLAWADDRNHANGNTEIYALILSYDGNRNGIPDCFEQSFDPASHGLRLSGAGGPVSQREPAVGAKGVFWLSDDPNRSNVWQCNIAAAPYSLPSSVFWLNTTGSTAVDNVRATSEGAAWLGPGIAGGPFEPWAKKVGGSAGIATILANPGVFDVSGVRYALTGGHGGNTDTDPDVFFWDKAVGQLVEVCSLGGPFWNRLRVQTTPAIAPVSGGTRIVWADSRHSANTAATDPEDLAYTLYVARTPTVSLGASTLTVQKGRSVTLKAGVHPNFAGHAVAFQQGTRLTFEHEYFVNGTYAWYTNWKPVSTKALSKTSTAAWTWTPTQAGTYHIRAKFMGGAKYTDGGRRVPHVANVSRVVKIVVK